MCCGNGRGWYRFVIMAVVGIGVAGWLVMALWNWLAPALFGGHPIHYVQALGLLLLSRLLFGGFHGRGGMHTFWRGRMEARWNAMTPEEREKFQRGMHGCWGRRKPADTPDGE